MPHLGSHQPTAQERLSAALTALEHACGVNSEFSANTSSRTPLQKKSAQDLRGAKVPQTEKITPFHSVRCSPMSMPALGSALRHNFNTTDEFMLAAVVILLRYCETTGFRPTLHSMHRMLAGCVALSVKTHCDAYYTNAAAGLACGLHVGEIHRLEATLCEGCDWRLLVESMEIQQSAALLRRIESLKQVSNCCFDDDLEEADEPAPAVIRRFAPVQANLHTRRSDDSVIHSFNSAADYADTHGFSSSNTAFDAYASDSFVHLKSGQ